MASVTIYYCDLCGEEAELNCFIKGYNQGGRGSQKISYQEICEKCYSEIYDFIKIKDKQNV